MLLLVDPLALLHVSEPSDPFLPFLRGQTDTEGINLIPLYLTPFVQLVHAVQLLVFLLA